MPPAEKIVYPARGHYPGRSVFFQVIYLSGVLRYSNFILPRKGNQGKRSLLFLMIDIQGNIFQIKNQHH